jgi:hypothetical protein
MENEYINLFPSPGHGESWWLGLLLGIELGRSLKPEGTVEMSLRIGPPSEESRGSSDLWHCGISERSNWAPYFAYNIPPGSLS